MKMKYIILLVYLLCSYYSLQAEIRIIPERDYFATVNELLARAENSIDVEMYLVHSNSLQVKKLLDELIEAGERGVRVNILLEDGQEENKLVADYLMGKGVTAKFDEPETKLHAKLILVDGKKLIIGSSNWTEKAFTENNESNVIVDLEEDKDKIEVLQSDYADSLLEVINRAQKEIDIVIFCFQFEYGHESKNYEIMSALLRAFDRGIKIKIIFDSWREGESGNDPAYNVLEQAGVEVYYDLDTVASHNKLVVIDNEITILGSANWTETGLAKNKEASILIRDAYISQTYKAYIDELIRKLPEKSHPRVPIPVSFLKKNGLFQKLHRKGMIEGIKLYTWLMWEAFTTGSFTLKRDYKGWYEAIYGESALPWSTAKSARISNLVRRLEKERAIKREKRGEEIALVVDKGEGQKDKNCIFVPSEFWTFGWIRKLSGSGLYFYLVNLAEFKKSPYKPVWLNSQTKIGREYGIRQRTIHASLKELMAYNLIEVQHDIPDPAQPFNKRKANRYFINPFWNEEELELKWKKIIERHGQDLFLKAREFATRINEPYDPKAVASLIMLIKVYGAEAVAEAINKATRLSFANGKWELRYIIGILQHEYTPIIYLARHGLVYYNLSMRKIDQIEKKEDIELVFIFGSQKENALRYLNGESIVRQKEPDLDIGILLTREAYQNIDDKFVYYGRLYDMFSEFFPDFKLDLILLNEVSIFIQAEAVKGYKLYQKNQAIFDEYLEELNRKYNDLDFIRKAYYREMQEAILHE